MQVAIPHALGKDEARRRLKSRIHELGDHLPGAASVETAWTGEDRMEMKVGAMGQALNGAILVEEAQVVFEIDLPMALSFIKPMVEGAIRSQGEKLLALPAK